MDIRSRQLTEADYDTLKGWWEWWRFPAPVPQMLPDNGTGGLMIEVDGVEVAAGFLYFTNSVFGFCEYIVSNPEVRDNEIRDKVIVHLINEISEVAKANGVKCLFTYVKNDNLEKKLLKAGYQVGTRGSNELIKTI